MSVLPDPKTDEEGDPFSFLCWTSIGGHPFWNIREHWLARSDHRGAHATKTKKKNMTTTTLGKVLETLERSQDGKPLSTIIRTAIDSIAEISRILREDASDSHAKLTQTNVFGDTQLKIDVSADTILRTNLSATGLIRTLSSEEQPTEHIVNEHARFSIAFDPLDGSSILPTNFAVGTIIGIWHSPSLVATSGQSLVAALAAVYGPRTTVYLTTPAHPAVFEATLHPGEQSHTTAPTRQLPQIKEGKLFAPANLRACADSPAYADLIQFYIQQRYTLRYTGGMVPDVTQILVKGFGVFLSPVSQNAPAKLRLLYEAMPMAKLIQAAGGATSDGLQSILNILVDSCEQRTPVCLGSTAEVARFEQYCHRKE